MSQIGKRFEASKEQAQVRDNAAPTYVTLASDEATITGLISCDDATRARGESTIVDDLPDLDWILAEDLELKEDSVQEPTPGSPERMKWLLRQRLPEDILRELRNLQKEQNLEQEPTSGTPEHMEWLLHQNLPEGILRELKLLQAQSPASLVLPPHDPTGLSAIDPTGLPAVDPTGLPAIDPKGCCTDSMGYSFGVDSAVFVPSLQPQLQGSSSIRLSVSDDELRKIQTRLHMRRRALQLLP
jgi:hypothetical protein